MKCALVGNQNSGKTTLFNELTGANQTVGNWPGVTIEKKSGHLLGSKIEVVDLPGIYSLSPYTSEEEVSRKYCFEEKPDLIINIIDATSLERSLYLTTQLLELDTDVVIALNMQDILEKSGITIDVEGLSKEIGCTVVSISAKEGTNIDKLIDVISKKLYVKNKHIKIYPDSIEKVIANISKTIDTTLTSKRFSAVKLIEHDKEFVVLQKDEYLKDIKKLEDDFGIDGEQLIASKRYDFIEKVKEKVFVQKDVGETITDKLDKIFLNKFAAIPIFVVVMALVYMLSVGLIGGLTVNLIDMLFNGADILEISLFNKTFEIETNFVGLGPWLGGLIEAAGGSEWAVSLVRDGIIAGVGAVCNFVPQIMILFTCLALLETTGYMSRISFFLDRVFHKFGLSGKSLIPFIVGSGCSVPAIMTCRTVEDEDEKHLSIILTPFIPCNAKLPIIALFSSYFFTDHTWLVSFSLYLFAIAIILVSGYVLKRLFYKGHSSTFVSELPQYKAPSIKYVVRDVGDKTIAFIKRAGSVILICSVVVWFLCSFTWRMEFVDGTIRTIDESMLASIGNLFSWFFYFILGGNLSWAATVSSIQGLVAKEQVISSMSVIAGVADETATSIFGSTAFGFFTPITAYAFMVFNLFSIPCFGAVGAMKKELGGTKGVFKAMLFQISVAWVLGSLIGLIQLLIDL